MKKILSYMGAALILVGLISPITREPEAPVANAEHVQVVNVQEEKPKAVEKAPEEPEETVVVEEKVEETPPPQPKPAPQVASTGTCDEWITAAGIGDVANANELIRRESGCDPTAVNPSSGACGVAQELPCGKSGCTLGDGKCQVNWMNDYVERRYGTWAQAVQFHNQNNWY